MTHFFVYVTASSPEEARKIGRTLVEERLAACVNILPGMQSIYHWDGALEEGAETVLIAKTVAGRLAALTDRVRALHSYDCPCVVALPIQGGNPDYLDWLTRETAGE